MSVVAFASRQHPTANQPVKDLYEVGEIPPLGHVPKDMYAWVIRRERHGPPEQSMQLEVVPTHTIGEPTGKPAIRRPPEMQSIMANSSATRVGGL